MGHAAHHDPVDRSLSYGFFLADFPLLTFFAAPDTAGGDGFALLVGGWPGKVLGFFLAAADLVGGDGFALFVGGWPGKDLTFFLATDLAGRAGLALFVGG